MKDTSWKKVGNWYNNLVGETGHYYHEHIILPGVLRLMALKGNESVLDLGCGQGVLARVLPEKIKYTGIDLANNLLEQAKANDKNQNHKFINWDITREMKFPEKFDDIAIILALQNVKSPFKVLRNVKALLKESGKAVIVLNHPAFRIPKHSDWIVDRNKMIQSRAVDNYMSPLEIPIESSPYDKKDNMTTFSYHWPVSTLSEMIFDNGMVIEKIEEWRSDKKSTGSMAKVEDKARREIPLFMTLVVRLA